MKIKILTLCFIMCFSLLTADTVDFSNWIVKIETKENPAQGLNVQTNLISTSKSLIKNLFFDTYRTVEEYLTENGKIARQYDRLNINSKESDVRYLSDGSTIYEYEVPITGSIMKLLVPGTGGGIPITTLCCPACARPWPEDLPVPEGVKLVPLENEFTPQYTGVLIDARDITLNPALFPKIYSDEDKEVYSLSFATSDYVIAHGLLSYTTSFGDAFKSERLGINPLRITALRSVGDNKTDIVISSASAKMMHSSQHNLGLLEHCQVVVLITE